MNIIDHVSGITNSDGTDIARSRAGTWADYHLDPSGISIRDWMIEGKGSII
jgi:hypothetical protein